MPTAKEVACSGGELTPMGFGTARLRVLGGSQGWCQGMLACISQ